MSTLGFHIGQRVRLRNTGEILTVAEFAGTWHRPTIVCQADDPESDWRICAVAEIEPVTAEPAALSSNLSTADRADEFDARIARWAHLLAAATLTPNQAEGFACFACGRNLLSTSVPIGYGPRGQVFVCCGCDEQYVRELAERAKAAEALPATVTVVAALHQLATDLDADECTDYADRVRDVIARLGWETIAVDQLLAEATVLAAHAPGVQVDARTTGDRLLSVVGGGHDE